ncbi:MAG: hypothetical protein NC400_13165 [Clostridium sp.]|nr:hypothetical protein [Clostridium sp.]
MVLKLRTLIDIFGRQDRLLQQWLFSFSCKQDSDIEFFLHNRAIEFELVSKARTYLIIDDTMLLQNNFVILGYFSLTLKTLSVPNSLSIRARKELDGFSGKFHREPIQSIPCYLIAQLARNSHVDKRSLSGNTILELACNAIASAVELVSGRYMMIECRNNRKLIQFYQTNFFKKVTNIADNDTPMIQMIRKI